ncbi:hypothetical protein BG000_011052 [Podila horticola]|nr:hypothetical protein BG000_011052 [Podila horticola]
MAFMKSSFRPGFLSAVAQLPELQYFQAIMTALKCDELHNLLRLPQVTGADSGLQTLILTFTSLARLGKLVGSMRGLYPGLTRLGLREITRADWHQQCALICRFPNLVSLDWAYNNADEAPAKNIARDLATKVFVKCPRIITAHILVGPCAGGSYVCRMVDSEVVAVVQALPKNLEALRLCGTSFAMALDCLDTCAGLVKFVAPEIAADELMKRANKNDETKPWPCRKQLQYLHAHFSGMLPVRPPGPRTKNADHERYRMALRQHKTVFNKLAELTWLDKLWLGAPGRFEWYDGEESSDSGKIRENARKSELMLNLATGLDALVGLKRLRSLIIVGLGQKMTMEDAQWMGEHWHFLTNIWGKCIHP